MQELKLKLENLLEEVKCRGYILEYDIEDLLLISYELENEGIYFDSISEIIDTDEEYFNDMIKHELDTGWAMRLWYYLQWVDLRTCWRYIRLNAYGNLEEIDANDFEVWVSDIIDSLN